MNEILASIVEIDNSTEILKENTEDFLKSEDESLREEFSKLDAQYNQSMKTEAQNQYDEIIESANSEVKKIIANSKNDLEKIKTVYESCKDSLVLDAVKIITGENK